MYPIIAALLAGATPGPVTAAAPAADRGRVPTGPQLVQTFDLTHAGPGTATLLGVEAGCGCLKPALSADALRPGETARLTLTVNTLVQPPGPHTWRATVRYRVAPADGAGPQVVPAEFEAQVAVSADLVPEVAVTPPMLAVSTAGRVTRTVTVTDRRAAPLTVVSATTTSPHLTAAVRPAGAADGVRAQQVDLTVADTYPPGQADETVVLLTTDPGCRELRVPVRVLKRAPGAVAVAPADLRVRFARGQAVASGLVLLRRPGGGDVRVDRADGGHPAVAVRASAGGPVATVRVAVDADKAGGRAGRADVKVWLADPPGEVVTVPVEWGFP